MRLTASGIQAQGDFPHLWALRDIARSLTATSSREGGQSLASPSSFDRSLEVLSECLARGGTALEVLHALGWAVKDEMLTSTSDGRRHSIPFRHADSVESAYGLLLSDSTSRSCPYWSLAASPTDLCLFERAPGQIRPTRLKLHLPKLQTAKGSTDVEVIYCVLHPSRFQEDGTSSVLAQWRSQTDAPARAAVAKFGVSLARVVEKIGTRASATSEQSVNDSSLSDEGARSVVASEAADAVLALVLTGLLLQRGVLHLLVGDERSDHVRNCFARILASSSDRGGWCEWLGSGVPQTILGAACPSIETHVCDQDIREVLIVAGCPGMSGSCLSDLRPDDLGALHESLLAVERTTTGDAADLDDEESEQAKTGAFYTPVVLVDEVLKWTLEPTLAEITAGAGDAAAARVALLTMTVCDPSCGSGNFLLGAAHRIARRVAQLSPSGLDRADDAHAAALAEVVKHCLYGADISRRAIALAKLVLWLEADCTMSSPADLDEKFVCGDALVGAWLEDLEANLPDAVLEPTVGDDVDLASAWLRDHRRLAADPDSLFASAAAFDVSAVRTAIRDIKDGSDVRTAQMLAIASLKADRWSEAILAPRGTGRESPVADFYADIDPAVDLPAAQMRRPAIHWEIAFPRLVRDQAGGLFDVVVGNPPYIRGRDHAQVDPRGRLLLSYRYKACQGGQWNLYVPFVLLAARLARRRSALLVQASILGSQYAGSLQRELLEAHGVSACLDFSQVPGLFPGAAVQVAALVVDRRAPLETVFVRYADGLTIRQQTTISRTQLMALPSGYWTLPTSDLPPVRAQLFLEPRWRLGDFSVIQDGMDQDAAYEIRSLVTESGDGAHEYRLVPTGLIDPFVSKWGTKDVRYLGLTFRRPVLLPSALRSAGQNKMLEQAMAEKIAVAGLSTRLEAVVDVGRSLISKSAFVIRLTDGEICPYAVAAVLNSSLINEIYDAAFSAIGFGAGSKNYRPATLGGLPMPDKTQILRDPTPGSDSLSQIGQLLHGHPARWHDAAIQSDLERLIAQAFKI